MKANKLIKLSQLVLLLSVLITVACTKTYEGFVEDPSSNRSFIPTGFRLRTAQDTAIFVWSPGAQAPGIRLKYKLELSVDSNFNTVDITKVVDTLGIRLIEPEVTINKRYFARLRVDAVSDIQPSRWVNLGTSFRIIGQQYLRIIRSSDITETGVSLNWFVGTNTADLDKVVFTTEDNVVTSFDLTPAEAAAGHKTITGLTAGTRYTVQIVAKTKSKGLANITTGKQLTFTRILSPGDNVATALASAVNGDLIGFNPGTYSLTSVVDLANKSITLRSVSNNPLNTKLKLRELNLRGDGAGIIISGLEIDANYNGTSYGGTFIQLKGPAGTDGAATVFKPVSLDNCIIHDFTTNIFRGNYGSAANVHQLPSFSMNNCIVYDINKTGSNNAYTFSIEKLLFTTFSVTRSTLYNFGAGLVNVSTALAPTPVPSINFDYCTINNFGSQGRYVLIDAGTATNVIFNFRNSIVSNTPLGVGGLAVSGTPHQIKNQNAIGNFTNNNYFNLNTAKISEGGFKMVLTGLYQFSNTEIDLGWTATTTDFSLRNIPTAEPLIRASQSANTIGDPRWAY